MRLANKSLSNCFWIAHFISLTDVFVGIIQINISRTYERRNFLCCYFTRSAQNICYLNLYKHRFIHSSQLNDVITFVYQSPIKISFFDPKAHNSFHLERQRMLSFWSLFVNDRNKNSFAKILTFTGNSKGKVIISLITYNDVPWSLTNMCTFYHKKNITFGTLNLSSEEFL